jgi:hypothetical protein
VGQSSETGQPHLHLNVIHAAAAARVKVSLRRLSPRTPQSALFVLFMSAARRRREVTRPADNN